MGLRLQSTAPNYAADATIDVMSNQQAITLQLCFWRVGYFLGWCVCVLILIFLLLREERSVLQWPLFCYLPEFIEFCTK